MVKAFASQTADMLPPRYLRGALSVLCFAKQTLSAAPSWAVHGFDLLLLGGRSFILF